MNLKAQELIDGYLLSGKMEDQKTIEANAEWKDQLAFTHTLIKGAERQALKQAIKKAKAKSQKGFKTTGLILLLLTSLALIVYFFSIQKEKHAVKRYQASTFERPLEQEQEESALDFTISPQANEPQLSKTDIKAVLKEAQNKEDTLTALPTQEVQLLKLNNQKLDTLFGKEGSCLIFQAHSFGKKEEEITLKLKEYYSQADILFSNLSTETTGGDYLESGGMLLLEAYTASGDTAYLTKDYQIGFPVKGEAKAGMALYYGQEQAETVKWEKAVQEEEQLVEDEPFHVESEIFTIVENMPSFEGSSNRDRKSLRAEFQKRIREAIRIPYTKEQLPNGTVYVSFVVDERGIIQGTRILRSLHPLLDQVAIKAIYTLPQMIPGTQRGKPVRVQYTVPIAFKGAVGDRTYSPEEFDAEMEQLKKQHQVEEAAFETKLLDQLDSAENNKVKTALISHSQYYLFGSSRIGWMNCDRPFPGKGKREDIRINGLSKGSTVKLISYRHKMQISRNAKGGVLIFRRIPNREKYQLFSIKQQKGKLFYAWKAFEQEKAVSLAYQALTSTRLKALKQQMEDLEKGFE